MSQNRSSAVMQQRAEPHDSLDFFPTPPWAARALCEHVLIGGGWRREQLATQLAWEPACGTGEMARGLKGYFREIVPSDIHDYGFGFPYDFLATLAGTAPVRRPDWIVTNPPFRLATQFIERGLTEARQGVAMLVRTAFIEGVDRYRSLYSVHRPAILAPFTERVPMVRGRCDPKASTATSYCWLVWSKLPHHAGQAVVRWIPPCRKKLEREGDYEPAEPAAGAAE